MQDLTDTLKSFREETSRGVSNALPMTCCGKQKMSRRVLELSSKEHCARLCVILKSARVLYRSKISCRPFLNQSMPLTHMSYS